MRRLSHFLAGYRRVSYQQRHYAVSKGVSEAMDREVSVSLLVLVSFRCLNILVSLGD